MSPIGYMKDLYTPFIHDNPLEWAKDKGSLLVNAAKGILTGTNLNGFPVIKPPPKPPLGGLPGIRGLGKKPEAPGSLKTALAAVADSFTAIWMENSKRKSPQSHISGAESFLGVSPAGQKYTHPERHWETLAIHRKKPASEYGGVQ